MLRELVVHGFAHHPSAEEQFVHERQETPGFAKSIERHALRDN